MKTTSAEHGQNMGRTWAEDVLPMFCACSFHGNSMKNLLSYCGLIDAKIRASDKDLPVLNSCLFFIYFHIYDIGSGQSTEFLLQVKFWFWKSQSLWFCDLKTVIICNGNSLAICILRQVGLSSSLKKDKIEFFLLLIIP